MIKTFTLKNDFLEVTILNLGCIIHEIKMPNRDGVVENIIHGFKNIEDYKQNDAYFQIRFIGVDKGGMELVRIEKSESDFIILGEKKLQRKGSKEYFQDTISLAEYRYTVI